MRHLKSLMTSALLCSALLCTAQNMGYLSRTKILEQMKGYTGQAKALDSTKIAYQKEIEGTKRAIDEKLSSLSVVYKPLPGEDLPTLKQRMNKVDQERLKLLEDENKMLENRIAGYNSILEQKYKTDVATYIEKLNAAIEAYAKKNRLDVVWDTDTLGSAAAWLNKAKDITAGITDLLK
ncbi:OmpH family outer membrane protein [Epilithonimonas sp. JDS]|uniref:OmpH family outer membrane protein n=1 Tax=Epilithonimonas sp. JDS TaxID=2902797 RepID=UPI001E576B4A|nr:OmpH family outer membrane protein [Epilithonimonas sp. JDS]MCD9855160.1 OmpH family outer membrane protein [Epilithonimonas sp. JDS]